MRSSGLYRCFALVSALVLVFVSLAITPQVRPASAQDGSVTLGDAPVLTDVSVASVTTAETPIITTSATVDPSTREASSAFYAAHFSGGTPAIGWTGNFDTCTPGTTSVAFQTAVLNRVAYFRAMAGVPASIGLGQTANEQAQHAALMMGKAWSLSHNPAPNWPCYTETGAAGAGNSNLALGMNGPSAITGYMQDWGAGNEPVGHRRWILYPQTQLFGTGDVPGANALSVFDGNYGSSRPATRDGFVAWPPPGYVPYQVTFPRWSFSYPGADFSGASVSVTTGGRAVQVEIESTLPGYGENTIVWRMEGLGSGANWPAPPSDRTYQVSISNVGGGAPQTFTYDVIVFDPADDGLPEPEAVVSPTRTTVNNPVTYYLTGYPANANVQITWKRPAGSTIDMGSARTDSSGNATGQFRVPATPGGAGQEITFTAGGVSKTVFFEVAPRIKVLTDPAVRGEEVNVSLRGYARQEVVRIRWRQPGGAWVELARVTTSNTGSANVLVTVPDWAADGNNSVRGDGTVFSQQTNAVFVQGSTEPRPPVADAGPDQTVPTTGATADVILDGRGSSAPGGMITGYAWATGTTEIATGPNPTVALPVGTHTITLTVTSSNGLTATDTVTITVVHSTGTPTVTITPVRTTVNSWITYTIEGYPANSSVAITWQRLSGSTVDMGTAQTDASGNATGQFRVPATPGGPNQEITFASGGVSETVLFEVAPRIKVLTDPGVRGEEINVSLRGYERREEVRIRWRQPDGTWVEVARVTTSNSGSANIMVTVPAWAPDGNNSVRGDGASFRQQTNVVYIEGGEFQPASVESPSQTPSPTETPTVTPTVTETPTEAPTDVPTEVATEVPSETPSSTETPVVTETPAPTETATPTETAPKEPPAETATEEADSGT